MARSATARLKVNPPLGQLPVLQYCSPDQLLIDESYQRSLEAASSQSLIRKIAVHWDWGLCQPLFVARRADNSLYVVDGQHRLAAAKLRGDLWQLPCVVTSFANAEEEAASFVALNQQRRPLNKLQLFKAALAAGDEEAAQIASAVEDAGLTIASTTNLELCPPGAICNIGGLQQCLRGHGLATLCSALDVLAQSYKGQRLRYAGTLFPGIAAVTATEQGRDPVFTTGDRFALMTEMIGGCEQSEWVVDINLAMAAEEATSRRQASEQVFAKAWAECTGAFEEADEAIAA